MSRSHENEIEIAAPPADVWKALTEGEELTRWFAVAAAVEPGEGGAWKVSWDESSLAEYGRIGAWEPTRRLRLVHQRTRGGETLTLIDDFELVALDGGARTRLRVVSSGFGSDASWDDEFEGTKNGWAVFIRNLRHYLEHHRGQDCETAGVPFLELALAKPEAFAKLFGDGGVLPIDGPLDEGRRVVIDTSFGERLNATIDFSRAPALLGLVVDGLGLVRAEFVGSETLYAHVMVLAHGREAQARLEQLREPLWSALKGALGGVS